MEAEVWRDVGGYAGYYQVSNHGRVKSLARRIWVTPSTQSAQGYYRRVSERILKPVTNMERGQVRNLVVHLWKGRVRRQEKVHVLVLEAFVGPRPSGMYGCHRDDNALNNCLHNLYWGTPAQNSADKIRHGKQQRGSEIPWSKLTEEDVRFIRANGGKLTQQRMAEIFGVGQAQISRVINRHDWGHVL